MLYSMDNSIRAFAEFYSLTIGVRYNDTLKALDKQLDDVMTENNFTDMLQVTWT